MKLKTKLFLVVFAGVVCSVIGLNIVFSYLGSIFNNGYAPNELDAIAAEIPNPASPATRVCMR